MANKTNTDANAQGQPVNSGQANGGVTTPAVTPDVAAEVEALKKQLAELQAKYDKECEDSATVLEAAEDLTNEVNKVKAENEALKKQLADAAAAPPVSLPTEPSARVKICNPKKAGRKMMVGDGSGDVVTFDEHGVIEVSAKEAARLLASKEYKKAE
jgi:seryl-tRNA synthetase